MASASDPAGAPGEGGVQIAASGLGSGGPIGRMLGTGGS